MSEKIIMPPTLPSPATPTGTRNQFQPFFLIYKLPIRLLRRAMKLTSPSPASNIA